MRTRGWGFAVAALAAVLGVSACSGGEADGNGDAGTTVSTLDPGRPMRTDLLRLDEVRPMSGLGYDVRPQPVLDRARIDVASLRGPCGATVATPFGSMDGMAVFRSTQSYVVEAAADAGPDAPALVASLRDEARPECTFREERDGVTLEVRGRRLPAGPEAGNEHVAWEHELIAPDGKVTRRLVAVYRTGGRVVLVAVLLEGDDRTVFGDIVERAVTVPG